MSHKKGFTLLEILLVVGIIAVLAAIVIIAINPGRQLATLRNTQRKSSLAEINKAAQQYYIDHSSYPGNIPNTLTEICNTGSFSTTTSINGIPCGSLVNLSDLVPTYMVSMPVDPQGLVINSSNYFFPTAYAASPAGTGFLIMIDEKNKPVLVSKYYELNDFIAIGTTTPPVFGCQTDSGTGFSAGDGSLGDPYQICSWGQLDNMRTDLSANYILTSNLSSIDTNYANFGSHWTPIGDCGSDCDQMGENNPFTGSFDGGNFFISNLVVDLPVISGVGLFGNSAGDISNVGLDGVSISGNSYVGGLVGRQQAGEISGVNISGSVAGYSYVGGIVGYQAGGSISNSVSSATVSEN